MAWYLNKALTTFRNEVNKAYPNRDKKSDGTIGDAAHQATSSDHNPDSDGSVDAWDMDVDLNSGNDKAAIEDLKKKFQAHPAARYWIHNRQIAERKYGWERRYYSGPSPHTEHVHWNSEPAYEDSTKPWGVVNIMEDDMSAQEVFDFLIYNPVTKTNVKFKTYVQSINRDVYEQGQQLDKLTEAVAKLSALAVPQNDGPITDEQLERVLRKVIGSVDNV